jgi:hypothetical protein
MLALAMLAVSSSSRSTTVGSGPPGRLRGNRTQSRSSYLTAARQTCAPAAVESAPSSASAVQEYQDYQDDECFDIDCESAPAIDRNHWSYELANPDAATTSDESVERPSSPAEPVSLTEPVSLAAPCSLRPAQLKAAEPVASLAVVAPSVDCRAWYDAAYDELIYGASPVRERSHKTAHAASDAEGLDSVEVIELFRSIFCGAGPESGLNACQRKSSFHAGRQATPAPMSWTEYGELIDAAVADPVAGMRTSAAPVLESDVRSGRGLLHSAATAVSRLEQFLSWVAMGGDDTVMSTTIATSAAARQQD